MMWKILHTLTNKCYLVYHLVYVTVLFSFVYPLPVKSETNDLLSIHQSVSPILFPHFLLYSGQYFFYETFSVTLDYI